MKRRSLVITSLIIPMLISSVWLISSSEGVIESQDASIMSDPPDYEGGYGFDSQTGVMEDTNGFRYSYQPDGIVKLELPWGYTTHFSFGLTAEYLDNPEQRTALDYSWTWDTIIGVELNETGNLTGYTYSFVATSESGVLGWEIRLDFSPTTRMKVTHTLTNGYAQALTDVNFWWLFDLRGTATPYTIETNAGIVEGPLYQAIPDSIHWVRLGNQFQFDWRDALINYENGHAYIGDGSVVGLDGLPILGISIELGDIASSATVTIDPYFSGVERTWNAAADGLASNPSRWSPVGVPDTGDNITFDGTSVFNCNWDVEVTLGDLTISPGVTYTGIITQTVDFGFVDYTQSGGTFTPSVGHKLTCFGNVTKTGGTFSQNLGTLIMERIDGEISFNSAQFLKGLEIENDTTLLTSSVVIAALAGGKFSTTLGADFTISSGIQLVIFWYTAKLASDFSNEGSIIGDGEVKVTLYDADKTFIFGDVENAIFRLHSGAVTSYTLTLGEDTVFSGDFTVISEHATNLAVLDSSDYTLTVDGIMTLDARAIVTQGTGAWSFGSYSQTGVSSVFNQGATLTIGGDFTVSAGIFNALGDMTVPGDWNTATGDYVNDDSAVYLTGASKTLAMHADDSFYNVTVSGSYTMDTDTTVRLRATISGTVDGTGDFLEPEPEFTSVPWIKGCPLELYDYEVTQLYWDTLTIDSAPYWLNLYDGSLKGIPGENETGLYAISLVLIWNDMVTYQNFTLTVCAPAISDYQITLLGVGLSIVLGFGLLTIGLTRDMSYLIVFAGFIWLVSSVTIYKDINLAWTIITFGIGAMILAEGGLRIVENSEL